MRSRLVIGVILLALAGAAIWLFLDREASRLAPSVPEREAAQVERPVPEIGRIDPGSAAGGEKAAATRELQPVEVPVRESLGFIGGRVTFGSAPDRLPGPIDMGSKTVDCGTAGRPRQDEFYVVGADGGAANVIVYVVDGPAKRLGKPVLRAEVAVGIVSCMYTPRVVGIRAGQPVRFENRGSIIHNIHVVSRLNGDWNRTLMGGTSLVAGEDSPLSEPLKSPELAVRVKCDIHPWMQAFIGVFDHDDFAVTGKDGLYELRSLPPGQYEVGAWHERAKATRTIQLRAGETKTLDFELRFER